MAVRARVVRVVAVGVCAAVAGGVAAPPAVADPLPPRARDVPPTAQDIAGSVAEAIQGHSYRRMGDALGCVQVRTGYRDDRSKLRKRPLLRYLITNPERRQQARRIARGAVGFWRRIGREDWPASWRRQLTLPRIDIRVVDRRYGYRRMERLAAKLTREIAERWIDGKPATGPIPGVSYGGGDPYLPHCPPLTISLRADRPPEYLEWAKSVQGRYGADRVALQIDTKTGTEPPEPMSH